MRWTPIAVSLSDTVKIPDLWKIERNVPYDAKVLRLPRETLNDQIVEPCSRKTLLVVSLSGTVDSNRGYVRCHKRLSYCASVGTIDLTDDMDPAYLCTFSAYEKRVQQLVRVCVNLSSFWRKLSEPILLKRERLPWNLFRNAQATDILSMKSKDDFPAQPRNKKIA